jgi:hypothetical protein
MAKWPVGSPLTVAGAVRDFHPSSLLIPVRGTCRNALHKPHRAGCEHHIENNADFARTDFDSKGLKIGDRASQLLDDHDTLMDV